MTDNRWKVLVVDDEPNNLQLLRQILQDQYQLSFATDGTKALDVAWKVKPDIILLDIMMPEMDGYETCKRLKVDPETSKIPVIFVTAMEKTEDERRGFEVGGVDYITKPVSAPIVLARVHTHLALYDQNRLLEEMVQQRTLELEIANRELMTLDDAKNKFLGLISHEIRTPLTGILGVTELLEEMLGEEPELSEFLEMLKISADRLEAFSATALTITQLQTKRRKISKSRSPAVSFVEEVFQQLREKAAKKSIALNMVVGDESIEMDADLALMQRALKSILDNAIRYSPESSQVLCTISMEDGGLVFEVADQGKGFSDEAFKNLFKPFGQGEPHYDQNVGLSLLTAKLIMEAHGGDIAAANREEGGAVVRMTFPPAF